MSDVTLNKLLDSKIVAIVRGIPEAQVVDLGEALYAGGIRCMEVTFDQSSEEKSAETLRSIQMLTRALGGRMCIGAGTVMSAEQVQRAADAGALYMISPNIDRDVIERTKELGLVSIPGAMTASEVAFAHACGADIVKIFPAGSLGPDYFKSILGPLKHIRLQATGGVNVDNCAAFLAAGAVGLGIGGNLVDKRLAAQGRFDELTGIAREYVRAAGAVQ